MNQLPRLIPISEIKSRLELIFPEGMPNRSYFVREMAAKTIFVMLYIGAIEGHDRWLGPKHVYAMTNAQSKVQSDNARINYGDSAWKAGYKPKTKQWYADTTREPIRDETLRNGFVSVGAAIENNTVATTSSHPRYCLQGEFALLLNPSLDGKKLSAAINLWRERHLSALALARTKLLEKGASSQSHQIEVTFPNRSIRHLAQGPSSDISKAVIEEFSKRFLYEPAVVLLSESGAKVIAQEDELVRVIGLMIDPSKLLPDIILFDLAPQQELLVFVEVVATDGPITEKRRGALLEMANSAHIPLQKIAFVTAYMDRDSPAFRKTFGAIAWGSLVWFVSEPENIVLLSDKPKTGTTRIIDLLSKTISHM